MSSKQDTKYAAKRRAANRKRIRDLGRNIFVYFFIGILVLGTASTVFIATSPASTTPTTTANPTPTNANGALFAQMLAQGDQALAAGKYEEAIGYYSAYVAQVPTDADVMFKLGKAYVDPGNPKPNYLSGVTYLQRAVSANAAASWFSEATALLAQYQEKANADVTATAASLSAAPVTTGTVPAITGLATVTATTVITK